MNTITDLKNEFETDLNLFERRYYSLLGNNPFIESNRDSLYLNVWEELYYRAKDCVTFGECTIDKESFIRELQQNFTLTKKNDTPELRDSPDAIKDHSFSINKNELIMEERTILSEAVLDSLTSLKRKTITSDAWHNSGDTYTVWVSLKENFVINKSANEDWQVSFGLVFAPMIIKRDLRFKEDLELLYELLMNESLT